MEKGKDERNKSISAQEKEIQKISKDEIKVDGMVYIKKETFDEAIRRLQLANSYLNSAQEHLQKISLLWHEH
ncbi:MAG: hypothetical protein ACOC5T_07795 [Elusimicrobiota bacterium]